VLIHRLSQVPGLKVIARNSSFAYRDPAANVREQFEVMNLHLILKLFDDLETARRQFKP